MWRSLLFFLAGAGGGGGGGGGWLTENAHYIDSRSRFVRETV